MTYALLLNDMRYPHIEDLDVVRVADDPAELAQWYAGQVTETWRDGRWGKVFRPGSDLEWYNPAMDISRLNHPCDGIWEVPAGTQPMKRAVVKATTAGIYYA